MLRFKSMVHLHSRTGMLAGHSLFPLTGKMPVLMGFAASGQVMHLRHLLWPPAGMRRRTCQTEY